MFPCPAARPKSNPLYLMRMSSSVARERGTDPATRAALTAEVPGFSSRGLLRSTTRDSMEKFNFLKPPSYIVLLACPLAFLAPAVAPAQEAPPRPFLRKVIQLDDAQLAAVEKGEVVTKLLPTTDKPEIAAFGVVKTAGTVDQLLALARDVQKFRQVPQIPEMGYFSSPAKIEDLKGLTHPPDDIAALKKCKPGSCDVKIGTKGHGDGLEDRLESDRRREAGGRDLQPGHRRLRHGLPAGGHGRDGQRARQEAGEVPRPGVPDAPGQLALPRRLRASRSTTTSRPGPRRSWPGPTTSSTGRRTPSASSPWSPPTTRRSTRAPAAP